MKSIEITVASDGSSKVETVGFSGDRCRQAGRFIEQVLRYGEHGPLVCRGDRMTYLVQPLSDVPPLPETAEPVMVDSATGR